MAIMAGMRVKLRVPDLLKEREWGPMDLVRRPEFSFAPATAYRLARGEVEAISMDTLERLADGFNVPVAELFVEEEINV